MVPEARRFRVCAWMRGGDTLEAMRSGGWQVGWLICVAAVVGAGGCGRDGESGRTEVDKPASIVFTDDLPKTRSGKIMRRLLKDISENRHLGDVTTLANADIVEEIAAKAQASTED